MAGETVMIPDDLPEDMPAFMGRFGTDQQCREYLFKARWSDGFRCTACGHADAYALKTKIVYECVACGKQHVTAQPGARTVLPDRTAWMAW